MGDLKDPGPSNQFHSITGEFSKVWAKIEP